MGQRSCTVLTVATTAPVDEAQWIAANIAKLPELVRSAKES
jgi:hypothetical protein